MEYKDALGTEIKVGDSIVYSTASGGGLQIGRVLELTTIGQSDYGKPLPQKIQTCKEAGCPEKGCWYGGRHPVGRRKYQQVKIPAIKIQGARKTYSRKDFEKMQPSYISKFENVVVLNNNLVVAVSLM